MIRPRHLPLAYRLLAGACLMGALGGCSASSGPRLVAMPGSVPGPPPSSIAPPITPVDHLEERALLLLMSDRRLFEPVSVVGAIEATPALRRQAAMVLARIGDPQGEPLLEGLLGDDDPRVRQAAALALGELAELGDPRAVPALLDAAAGDQRQLAVLAVEGLAKAGVDLTEVVERLVIAPAGEILPRLVPSLFRFDDPAVVRWAEQGLEPTSGSTDNQLRARAAYALSRNPRPEAAPIIRSLLDDGDPWVRGWAARALATVGERADLERLRPFLDDASEGPTIQALRSASALAAAGKASAPADWLPRMLELLDDPRPGVRVTAIEASVHWLGTSDELGDRLLTLVRQGTLREQELALGALAAADDPRVDVALPLAMARQEPVLRAAAARAAGSAGEADVLDAAALDPDPGVRRAALDTWLLADIGSELRVRLALEDEDYAVRSTALEWLAEQPVVEIELLISAYQRALRDRGADARLSATSAVTARADSEPLERGAAIEFLEVLAEEAEYLVRRQAIRGLRQLDREPPELGAVATGRTIGVYRDIALRTAGERYVEMATDKGTLRLRLDCPQAPLTCLSFLQLAGQGFYDGLTFHRVVPDFVIQGGDPRGDGVGGPGYTLRDEINLIRYERGTIGMAHAGPDTAGSQFFVTLAPQPHLDGGYTAFGQVIGGDQVLDLIMAGDRILFVREVAAPR